MIRSSITTRTTIGPSSLDRAGLSQGSSFKLAGKTHALEFDGKVDRGFRDSLSHSNEAFDDIKGLTGLMKSEGVQKARTLIDSGAETVKVSTERGDWTASQDESGGLQLKNDRGSNPGEQTITLDRGYISLETTPSLLPRNESATHTIVGKLNQTTNQPSWQKGLNENLR